MHPAETRRALLAAMDVSEDDLVALRAGTVPPALRRRVRSHGAAWLVSSMVALVVTPGLYTIASGSPALGVAPQPLIWLLIPVAVGFAAWLAWRGARTLRDTEVDVIEAPAIKTRTQSRGRWNEALVMGADRFSVDALGISERVFALIPEDATMRAYVTRRGRVLLAIEPR